MNLGDDIGQPAALSRAVVAGFATAMIGFVNGMAIALKAGIPADLFMQHSSTVNGVLMGEQVRAFEAIRDDDTKSTEASLNTWAAAHETIHSIAKSLGTNLVLQDAVQAVFQEAKQVGLGQHDISALVSVFCNEQGDS